MLLDMSLNKGLVYHELSHYFIIRCLSISKFTRKLHKRNADDPFCFLNTLIFIFLIEFILRTCEICNSVARNVVGPNDIEGVQQASENAAAVASNAPAPSATETRTCLNGHRFLNFLLACMVFAFVISWLFHFNIPS